MHPDDEIDRKRLRALVARVNALHARRLAALHASFSPEHRTLLEALPVLLHTNHAALPGFVDFDTPAGIDRYTPSDVAVEATRKLALSFTLERFRERSHALRGVFVLAPESERDRTLDVWVLAARAQASPLAPKLRGIAAHARRAELELRFRVVDPLDARNPRATADDAVPRLALERFYRDGIKIAGRLPLWWLVPSTADAGYASYAERLLAQRHVQADDVVDLGNVDSIPIDECLDAATALLERTLEAPFRHLPMLTLLESYIDGAPLLAARCKAEFHSDDAVAIADTGTLVHNLLEEHLASRDAARLSLVRQCLVEHAKREQVDAVAAACRWPPEERRHLGARAHWRFCDFLAQDRLLRGSLESTCARLERSSPTSTHASLRARLDAIGARLRPPTGGREIVGFASPEFVPTEARLRLALRGEPRAWHLDDADEPISDAGRLTCAALRAFAFGLSAAHVQVAHGATRVRFGRLCDALARELPHLAGDALLLLVNAEETPTRSRTQDGEALVTSRDDALDFSGFRTSLVEAIDTVARREHAFELESAVGIDDIPAAIARAAGARASAVICIDGAHARVIEERLTQLIVDARAALGEGHCFVFALSTRCVALLPGTPARAEVFASYSALTEQLRAQLPRTAICLDPRASAVAELAKPTGPSRRPGATAPR